MNDQNHSSPFEFLDWGLVDYFKAQEKQLQLVDEVASTQSKGYIVFCQHPEIVTLGRSSKAIDLVGWNGPVTEVSRGGRATYHGPSQLVIYPIINLKHASLPLSKQQDVAGHLRWCEQIVIDWLATHQIQATGKSLEKPLSKDFVDADGEQLEETGVWVGGKKIASLGIAVKKWITYHGIAINIMNDPKAYRGLNPCGFNKDVMTNLELLLKTPVEIKRIKQEIKPYLL